MASLEAVVTDEANTDSSFSDVEDAEESVADTKDLKSHFLAAYTKLTRRSSSSPPSSASATLAAAAIRFIDETLYAQGCCPSEICHIRPFNEALRIACIECLPNLNYIPFLSPTTGDLEIAVNNLFLSPQEPYHGILYYSLALLEY